ncbi:DMT family transporter [Piscinibacter gummiphilus]|uniref:DMT family transporter n=1 Tax=Piscinibacter gummiphilus TaxID=946333 RepID=A0ABZ0D0T7_9BURK|nr:DMT family transporter [Piscinibacter gummiphilus]WOB10793.1 DMT family transporter [Piscinibacter gummiphilus]
MTHRPPVLAYLFLASSMALVGSYVALSKTLVIVFPVFLLAWLRFGIAAVAMASWVRRAPDEAPLSRHDRTLLFFESFFGNFLFSVCMLFGVSMTSALAAGVIMAAIPAMVALMSWVALRERITAQVAGGIACAVGGIALVSLVKHEGGGSTSLLGNALLFCAVACEASYVVIGKKLTGKVSAKRISALVNLWGLALVTPFGVWQAWRFDFSAVAMPSWTLLVFYSLAASMVTVWLWMTGLKHVQASSAGVFTVFLPVSTALVGVLFLGERFDGLQVGAFALALVGVVLATWPSGRDRDGRAAPVREV